MARTYFVAVNYKRNEYGICPGGIYAFTFEGQLYHSTHLANGPQGLESSFVVDIERSASNFLAHLGADETFYAGVRLPNGHFAHVQAFTAWLGHDYDGEEE
mgnify:CR=1 FL=1